MKKFFFTLIILLILGGTVFFFGWAQLTVPPGSYGVIISKTHGIDPNPVQTGEFRWIWYKLIPTNVKIAVFKPETVKFPMDFNSSLPSGEIYSSMLDGVKADFSWNIKGELSYKLKTDMLVSVISSQNITEQDELYMYLYDISGEIKSIILMVLSSPDMNVERLENILSGNQDTELLSRIYNQFPEIDDFSLKIQSAKIPDFVLYRELRMFYEDYLRQERQNASAVFSRKAEAQIESRLHFGELERYGELLTKYPVLLEYLKLGNP